MNDYQKILSIVYQNTPTPKNHITTHIRGFLQKLPKSPRAKLVNDHKAMTWCNLYCGLYVFQ